MLKDLKTFLKLLRPYKRRVRVGLLLGAIAGLCTGAGITFGAEKLFAIVLDGSQERELSEVIIIASIFPCLFLTIGVMTLIVELGAPLFLLHRRGAMAWAVSAFFMHWGIFFIMGIRFRYQLAGLIFASFFPVDRWVIGARNAAAWIGSRVRGAPSSQLGVSND